MNAMTGRLRGHLGALLPGLAVVALFLLWAVHDGGYDADTWYWGALVMAAALTGLVAWRGAACLALPRPLVVALVAFTAYVAFSYLSITWAASPGDALEGSNRALLYLLLFAFLAMLPWTPEAALAALLAFALGLGVIALVLLWRLAGGDHVGALVIQGRLAAPTGYFNGSAALFTIGAVTSLLLASRREVPVAVRGLLLAGASAGLQLAVIVQSRGWLFTLPLVALASALVARRRAAVVVGAGLVAVSMLAGLHRLLAVYGSASTGAFVKVAERAGQAGLLATALAGLLGAAAALLDARLDPARIGRRVRRAGALALGALALAGAAAGAVAVTHGHPLRFVSRQWQGFSHEETVYSAGSHFTDVGSGRYDFWRAALKAFLAHPLGGLGQDNFADYYVRHRSTSEEPMWTHSLEMRLLAHTGLVGAALFLCFLVAALVVALRARRARGGAAADAAGLRAGVAAAALGPLIVWLIHGSIDWFWEIPALSGPALGFLAVAGALDPAPRAVPVPAPRIRRLATAGAFAALLAVMVALGPAYLAVRELSIASDLRAGNPAAALHALDTAARLDPLSAEPGRVGGMIALENGEYASAQARFAQAIAREPGGWLGWLGAGLAASQLRERAAAEHDFVVAESINDQQPAVRQALADIRSPHPLTVARAIALLVPVA